MLSLLALLLICLFWIVAETILWPKALMSIIALRRGAPRKNSLSFQNGFWKRSPVAPEAKSKDLENGKDAGISIYAFIQLSLLPFKHIVQNIAVQCYVEGRGWTKLRTS